VKILMVEDEPMTRIALTDTLRKEGHEVLPCPDGHVATEALASDHYDLMITDLNLPGPDGLELLKTARAQTPAPHVIIMTAYASAETAVEALRQGAYDYITKPFQTDEVLARVRNLTRLRDVELENSELRRKIAVSDEDRIIGTSRCMMKLNETIDAVAPGEANVLVQGPSGTGKELVARAVHSRSARHKGPFVAVNCSAIPETLVESELFGHRKGAFTGADRDHTGYFQRARGGSLFIDEIDDLPMATQVKLLRVIQEREIEPVGGGAAQPIDIRLIAATKQDLKALAAEGRFREDLYYRLNVIPLRLPTLAERREDIPALIEHFAKRLGRQEQFPIDSAQYKVMMAYEWPGNVRELGNVVERMIALPGVSVADLIDGPINGHSPGRSPGGQLMTPTVDASGQGYRHYMQQCEDQLLEWALGEADGNISTAAKLLDLPRSTLRSKLDQRQR
jgi:two-component system response regulator PilR (NtrC family)